MLTWNRDVVLASCISIITDICRHTTPGLDILCLAQISSVSPRLIRTRLDMALAKNAARVTISLPERSARRNVHRGVQAHVPLSHKFPVAGRILKSSDQKQRRQCAIVCSIGDVNRARVIVRAHGK